MNHKRGRSKNRRAGCTCGHKLRKFPGCKRVDPTRQERRSDQDLKLARRSLHLPLS